MLTSAAHAGGRKLLAELGAGGRLLGAVRFGHRAQLRLAADQIEPAAQVRQAASLAHLVPLQSHCAHIACVTG